MKRRVVLVISKHRLLRDGLKRLIEDTGAATVIMAPDQESVPPRLRRASVDAVVLEKPNIELDDQACSLLQLYQPAKVILLGWNDDRLAVYSRRLSLPATVKNLIGAITK
jgi:DNA-binding NarL/FixJ family response regulator